MHKIQLLPLPVSKRFNCHCCKAQATDEAHIKNHTMEVSIKCCKTLKCVDSAKQRASDHWQEHLDGIEAVRKAKEEGDAKQKLAKPPHKSRQDYGRRFDLSELAIS